MPEEPLFSAGAGPDPGAITILQVDTGLVIDSLAELVAEQGAVRELIPDAVTGEPVVAVFLVPFHRAEISLAGQLRALARTDADRSPGFARVDWDRVLGWLQRRAGTELAPEQAAAVRLALTERVAVLTGGPGCGKSFTVRSIVTLAAARDAKVVLAAPAVPTLGSVRPDQGLVADEHDRPCPRTRIGGRDGVRRPGSDAARDAEIVERACRES